MSKWLALAEAPEEIIETPPDSMTKPDKTSDVQPEGAFCQVLSNCQVEVQKKPEGSVADEMRHGHAVNGYPKTWSGAVVSLDEWRRLSEWQKHGPNGRMWCGACSAWVHLCEHIQEQKK